MVCIGAETTRWYSRMMSMTRERTRPPPLAVSKSYSIWTKPPSIQRMIYYHLSVKIWALTTFWRTLFSGKVKSVRLGTSRWIVLQYWPLVTMRVSTSKRRLNIQKSICLRMIRVRTTRSKRWDSLSTGSIILASLSRSRIRRRSTKCSYTTKFRRSSIGSARTQAFLTRGTSGITSVRLAWRSPTLSPDTKWTTPLIASFSQNCLLWVTRAWKTQAPDWTYSP